MGQGRGFSRFGNAREFDYQGTAGFVIELLRRAFGTALKT